MVGLLIYIQQILAPYLLPSPNCIMQLRERKKSENLWGCILFSLGRASPSEVPISSLCVPHGDIQKGMLSFLIRCQENYEDNNK